MPSDTEQNALYWMNLATKRGEDLHAANLKIEMLQERVADLQQKLSGAQEDLAGQAVMQDPDPLAELARAAEGKK